MIFADFGVHFGGDFRCCRTPGADRPYRLVSDNDMGKVRRGQLAQSVPHLPADDFRGLAGVAFGQGFADTDNGFSPPCNGRRVFFSTVSSVSPKYCRRSEWPMIDVRATDIEQHLDEISPVNAPLLFPVNILSGNRDARAVRFFDRRCQRRKWRRNDDVAVLDILNFRNQRVEKCPRLRDAS